MKVIQSFWSKPSTSASNDPNARFKGGWIKQKYAFYSQALSCLTFKQFYDDVELYTDKEGKQLLVDTLGIPYTRVEVTLNEIDAYNSKLWALGKIFTYAAQDEPFLHSDSDVFIWEKLPAKLTDSSLFTQNIEEDFPAYQEALEDIFVNFDWVPTELINSLYKHKKIMAFNAGIIGGHDLDFFKKLKQTVVEFIEKNSHLLEKIDVGIFNTIFEQQLGYALAEKNNIPVEYYLLDVDSDFSGVINFHTVPFHSKYVHCIGYSKKSIYACEQVEARLKYHFPDFYEAFNRRLKKYFKKEDFTSDFSQQRFDYIFKMYDWMASKSTEEVFNTIFKINPSCEITKEKGGFFITYKIPQAENQFQKDELKDWEAILLYFEEPTTIKQLHSELCKDESFLEHTDKEGLKNRLISYVMDKTLLLEILQPQIV